MVLHERRAYLQAIRKRYRQSKREDKGRILDEFCKVCGGHIYTDHPTMGLVDVPAVVIQGLHFAPGFHVHYQESVHHIRDGLPKFRDLPTEAGGSGMELAE